MKKRLIAVIVALALVLVSLTVFLVVRHVRNNRPPTLESLRERVIALIDNSNEINEIFWGEGLPTYPRVYSDTFVYKVEYSYKDPQTKEDKIKELTLTGLEIETEEHGTVIAYPYYRQFKDPASIKDSDICWDFENQTAILDKDGLSYYRYAVRTNKAMEEKTPIYEDREKGYYYYRLEGFDIDDIFFYTEKDDENYDYVTDDCGYYTVDSIKEKAEVVYAQSFLSSIYESMFTGIKVSENDSGTLYARYADHINEEGEKSLMKSNTWQAVDVSRVYLYDTMRMSEKRKSNATDVFLEIDSYVPGKEGEIQTITVSLTLQRGLWYLNSATY